MKPTTRTALIGATMLCGFLPAAAWAQDKGKASAEDRISAIEAQLAELKAELEAARAEARAAQLAVAQPRLAPAAQSPAAAPAPSPAGKHGVEIAGTTIKVSGFLKTVASVSRYSGGAIAPNAVGRDFYVPGSIPVGGVSEGESFEASVKQTRVVVSTDTPIAGHSLKGWIELDFQVSPGSGNQRMTNAYNPGLRRAFISYDGFLIGQDWTNFQYVGALPESTDYLGPGEGTVFVRQVQLRYTTPLGGGATLSVAAENPATTVYAAGTSTMAELGSDRIPDITARLNLATRFGEFSLAALGRELTANNGAAADNQLGWGVSFGGKIPLGSPSSDLRFMVSHGEGAGRYIGLNLAPDAILYTAPGSARLETVDVTAGFAAVKIGWAGSLRSTFTGSAQRIGYPTGQALAGSTRSAWSASANLFYSPVRPLDLGIEIRHGERALVSGASGSLDRLELAARLNF